MTKLPIARLNDNTFGMCSVHGAQNGKIISSSGNINVNGRRLSRVGDVVLADCGHISKIITGSKNSYGNNKLVARVTSKVSGPYYTAIVISGSNDTYVS